MTYQYFVEILNWALEFLDKPFFSRTIGLISCENPHNIMYAHGTTTIDSSLMIYTNWRFLKLMVDLCLSLSSMIVKDISLSNYQNKFWELKLSDLIND